MGCCLQATENKVHPTIQELSSLDQSPRAKKLHIKITKTMPSRHNSCKTLGVSQKSSARVIKPKIELNKGSREQGIK